MKNIELTDAERKAVSGSIRGSLDLYRGYVKIPYIEDQKQARKKAKLQKVIPLLESALSKIRDDSKSV